HPVSSINGEVSSGDTQEFVAHNSIGVAADVRIWAVDSKDHQALMIDKQSQSQTGSARRFRFFYLTNPYHRS
ncbi:MAG: hypothetical protein MN733_43210, partial [Nitrososphaera sp.]|nr:hypothetical protein [Nitrososphaera sp.]